MNISEAFTPIQAIIGGSLIGLSAALFILINGRIAGFSGILSGVLSKEGSRESWRWIFLLSTLVGACLAAASTQKIEFNSEASLLLLCLAGLLVGFGARLGSGCTSGHGVCGISRASPRSIAATITFMATGFLTASIAGNYL